MHTHSYKLFSWFLLAFLVVGGVFYIQADTSQAAGQYTWKEQADADDPTGKDWIDIYMSANGEHLVTTTGTGLWVSHDSGETWSMNESSSSTSDIDQVAVINDGSELYYTRGKQIHRIDQNGQSLLHSVPAYDFGSSITDGFDSLYVSPDGQFIAGGIPVRYFDDYNNPDGSSYDEFLSYDGGVSWERRGTGRTSSDYPPDRIHDYSNSGEVAAFAEFHRDTFSEYSRLYVFTQGSGSYSRKLHDDTGGDTSDLRLTALSLAVSGDGSHIYSNAHPSGSPDVLYRSTDGGDSFEVASNLPDQTSDLDTSHDGQEIAAVMSGQIYTSDDAGDSWIQQSDIGSRSWRGIAMSADGTKLAAIENGGSIFTTVPDETPPTLASTSPFSPADDATGTINDDPIVTFSESVVAGSGSITLYNAADDSVMEAIDVTSGQITGTGSDTITISPSAGLQDGVSYYIQIDPGAFADFAGNNFAGITDSTTWNFTVGDNTAPANSNLVFNPADNSTQVAVDSDLSIIFPEVMEVQSGDITIYENANMISTFETINASSSQVTGDGTDTITIDPSNEFAEEMDYYVRIDDGALADTAGNDYGGISDSTTWNFTTEDATPPQTSNLSPTDDATDVTATDLYPEITFDENVESAAGSFTIYNEADDTVFNQLNTNGDRLTGFGTDTITAFPTEDFNYDTDYYIQITNGGITDEAGNDFAGITDSTTWNFTTDTPSPAEAAANGDIVINFDEAVEIGTGTVSIHELSTGNLHEDIDVTSGQVTITDDQMSAIISPSTELDDDTSYYVLTDEGAFVYVSSGEPVPAITDETEWDFKTEDETAPTTSASDPEDGGDSIDLVFDEPVNTGDGNIELRRGDDDSLVETISADNSGQDDGGQVSGDGTDTLTITPNEPLDDGTSYYFAPESGAITDTSGNSLPEDNYEFTTGDTAPTTEETSVGTTDGTDDSSDDSDTLDSFTLVFDEPVEQGSGTVTIYRSDNNDQVESIDVASGQITGYGTRYITVVPTNPLDASTSYYLHISPGAFVDSTGNDHPGVDDDSLEFTTGDSVIPVNTIGQVLQPRAPREEEPEEEPELVTEPILCRPYLVDPLRRGADNDRVDVLKLQSFLEAFAKLDTPMSGVFGEETEQAVETFQVRHATDILTPWGYPADEPTGYVYITTLNKINEIYCGREFSFSNEEADEINEFRSDQGLEPILDDSVEVDAYPVTDDEGPERESEEVDASGEGREDAEASRVGDPNTDRAVGDDNPEEADTDSRGELIPIDRREGGSSSDTESDTINILQPATPTP